MNREYPYYGNNRRRHDKGDWIVYFIKPQTGMVITDNQTLGPPEFRPAGQWYNHWAEFRFNPVKDKQKIKELEKKRKILQITG